MTTFQNIQRTHFLSFVPATTAHWCKKGEHAYRCSHLETETCAHGNHSEVNCPEHGGPNQHRTVQLKGAR